MRILLLPLSLVVFSCTTVDPLPPAGTAVSVTRLRSDAGPFMYYSQLRQSERLVIRDHAAWVSAWASLWPRNAPIPAPPAADFSKEMIVLAALGERPSGGYGISVDSARASATSVLVFVGTTAPGSHCGTTLALTQPVDIARLPRIDGAVTFTDVPRVIDCP